MPEKFQFNVLRRDVPIQDTKAVCHECGLEKPTNDFNWMTRAFYYEGRVGLSFEARRAVFLHRNCLDCRSAAKRAWTKHPLYSRGLEAFWDKRLQATRAGAYARSIVFAVDKDDLVGMFLEQNGKCALSGIEMNFKDKGASARGRKALLQPSVDRIDSNMNYTLDNIQIVAMAVNLMKGDLRQENFISLCRSVVKADDARRLDRQKATDALVRELETL